MKKLFKKRWVRWTLLVIGLVVAGTVIFGRPKPVVYETAPVTRANVVESVTATGQIKPKNFASLRFEASGSIAELRADVGDTVKKGQLLGRLNAGELYTRVLQAEAEVKAAQVALTNASVGIGDTETKNDQSLSKVYADAVVEFDEIFNLAQKAHGTFKSFYTSDEHLIGAVAANVTKGAALQAANEAFPREEAANEAIVKIITEVRPTMSFSEIEKVEAELYAPLRDIRDAVIVLLEAVNTMEPRNTTQAAIDAYRTSVETAQTNINSAISKRAARVRLIEDTKTTNTLNLSSSNSTYTNARANLEKAQAALKVAQASLSNASLYAPISGVIGARNKNIGESVTPAEQVFYLLGEGGLEVIANIPEVDIGRVAVGAVTDATLDALGPDAYFKASVVSIDPDQTTVEGVVYYRTHFEFNAADPRFKSGMTVNLTIELARKENVLSVPRRAVTQKDGKSMVKIFKGEGVEPEERAVAVGLRGEVTVEIISGVKEGDQVVLGEKRAAIR